MKKKLLCMLLTCTTIAYGQVVDTYADVYLNGALILKSDNMFVGHSLSVKEVLRLGENKLNIFSRNYDKLFRQLLPTRVKAARLSSPRLRS